VKLTNECKDACGERRKTKDKGLLGNWQESEETKKTAVTARSTELFVAKVKNKYMDLK
jgi:hypothetical protein